MRNFGALFLSLSFLVLGSCVSSFKQQNSKGEVREPASAGPIYAPCRDSRDCQGNLVCRKGWCVDSGSSLGEANENCSLHQDCRSGVCENGICKPTFSAPANNGDACFGADSSCRSGNCEMGRCQATANFGGFAGQVCSVSSDCLSGNCRTGICAPGSNSMSCAWVGEAASVSSECCSQHLVSGICYGRSVGACSPGTNCGSFVGKVCAAPGQRAQFANECCSGRISGSMCVQDYSSPVQYCLKDSNCASGHICHPKSKTCVSP